MQIKSLNTLINSDDFRFEEIFKNRGLSELEQYFLNPIGYEYHWSKLDYLDNAIKTAHHHITKGSKILIILDTDTDGITSGTIIYRYLNDINKNANISWVIGDGKTHGITQHYSEELGNFDLIIACDSLSNEYDTYEQIVNHLNVDLILLDHHGATPIRNDWVITVNSENFDYPNPTLSGAGVAYKFCQAYDEMFGYNFADKYLDLAACGIIADVSDLSSLENRSICYRGFNNLQNLGLTQLLKGYAFNSQAISFSIATVINACNRLNENELASRLLLSDDEKEVKELYKKALALKAKQDMIYTQELHEFNIQNSDGSLEYDKFVYFVTSVPNLSGYIAQKLAELTGKSAIVLSEYEHGYSGSIRSQNVSNFRDICCTPYSLAQGHPEAAGIKVYKLDNFLDELNTRMVEIHLGEIGTTTVDITCKPDVITTEIAKKTEKFNTLTGRGFPQLSYYFKGIAPDTITTMKDKHTKFTSGDITFLLWNDTNLYDLYQTMDCPIINCVGTLSVNKFRGKEEINFVISAYEITDFNPFI